MRAPVGVLLAALAALAWAPPGGLLGAQDAPWELLAERRLVEALERSGELDDRAEAARLEVEVWYLGSDFARARRSARAYLEQLGPDALLALRAAEASLWLREGDQALADLERLEAFLPEAVEPAHHGAWRARIEEHRTSARALQTRRAALEGAHARSRSLALGGVALAALALLLLAWPRSRTLPTEAG